MLVQLLKPLPLFDRGGSALLVVCGPLQNLQRTALVCGVCAKPLEDFPIPFSQSQLLAEGRGVHPDKPDKMLIQRAIIVVLPVGSRNFCAPLVEHSGKNHKAAQSGSDTARGAFGKVGGVLKRVHKKRTIRFKRGARRA